MGDELEAMRQRAEAAEAQLRAIDEAIGDRGLTEKDCSLPMPERVSNIITEMKEGWHYYGEEAVAREKAERERDELRAALVARHGGEPIALLRELDAARAEIERLTRERDEEMREREREIERCAAAERERDELRAALAGRTGFCAECERLTRERDEARAAALREVREWAEALHSLNRDDCREPAQTIFGNVVKFIDELLAAAPKQADAPAREGDDVLRDWLKEYDSMRKPGGPFITRERHALAELCRRALREGDRE